MSVSQLFQGSDEWSYHIENTLPVIEAAIPHRTLPQLLRPMIARLLPTHSLRFTSQEKNTAASCVVKLSIRHRKLSTRALEFAAAELPHVTELDLREMSPGGDGLDLSVIGRLKALTSIDLTECMRTDLGVFRSLATLPDLQRLILRRCRTVTAECFHLLGKHAQNLTHLDLSKCGANGADFEAIACLKSLRILIVTSADDHRLFNFTAPIAKLTQLTSLSLNRTTFDHSHLECLLQLSLLEELILKTCIFQGGGGPFVSQLSVRFPRLHTLDFSDTNAAGITASSLAKITQLTSLHVSNFRQGDGAILCGQLTRLKTLGLIRCMDIIDVTDLSEFSTLPHLTALDLTDCDMDQKIREASVMPRLRLLSLASRGVEIEDFEVIARSYSSLTELDISCDMNETTLDVIGNTDEGYVLARQLRTLSIAGAYIDPACCHNIANFTVLEELHVNVTNISGDQFKHLEGLRRLRKLNARRCSGVNEASLREIAKVTSLERLDLAQCPQIDSVGIAHLTLLTRLVALSLEGCEKVSDASLLAFRHVPELTFPM